MTKHPATRPGIVGRAAQEPLPNRFERVHRSRDLEQLDHDETLRETSRAVPTEFLPDASKTIIRENNSPDIPFRFSINPYRGCEHGCAYCYARPSHETLGFDAGLDFESKILVKEDGPELLRRELNRAGWQTEPITVSGVTDCYQPAERRFRLTRRYLEVMLEARQPVSIITKNALVTRDLDLLRPLAERNLVHVNLSISTLDAALARSMEPRTSTPEAKLRAIRELNSAGVLVRVMVAPVIPGLTDEETPAILQAARAAGARAAAFVLLRLPPSVQPVFTAWLAREYPTKRERVESLIRATRGGALTDERFGHRMRGAGPYAEQIAQTFKIFATRHGLTRRLPELDSTQFRPPRVAGGQMRLF